ncbi:MAG: hypothetical protein LBI81_03380 [Puniceicoccales bacterium]|nr:hypothetical protein [Puniceicoccales bacterium]
MTAQGIILFGDGLGHRYKSLWNFPFSSRKCPGSRLRREALLQAASIPSGTSRCLYNGASLNTKDYFDYPDPSREDGKILAV